MRCSTCGYENVDISLESCIEMYKKLEKRAEMIFELIKDPIEKKKNMEGWIIGRMFEKKIIRFIDHRGFFCCPACKTARILEEVDVLGELRERITGEKM